MRLPFSVKSRINTSPRFQEHLPGDWNTRKDWVEIDGQFKTEDGRYKIVEDLKYGHVIAEIKNVGYTID
jgi:hypothetical protein